MSRIYVAARFEQADFVDTIYDKLYKLGHEITKVWTCHSEPFTIRKGYKRYGSNVSIARRHSEADIEGVVCADVFILLANEFGGQGKYVELGTAIVSCRRILIYLPQGSRDCMFFYHSKCEIYEDIDELIASIKV